MILYSIVEQDKMGGIFNQLISFSLGLSLFFSGGKIAESVSLFIQNEGIKKDLYVCCLIS